MAASLGACFTFLGHGSAHVVLADNQSGGAVRIFLDSAGRSHVAVEAARCHVATLKIIYGKYLPLMTCYQLPNEVYNTKLTMKGDKESFLLQDGRVNGENEWGLKVCNMMEIWLPLPMNYCFKSSPIVITVELKPKAANVVAAKSLLVGVEIDAGGTCSIHNHKDIKFKHSRFVMNQFHKKTKHGISSYTPHLLFKRQNLRTSLVQLFETPQNNLKIFVNGRLFDMDVGELETERRDEELSELICKTFGVVAQEPISWFISQITTVIDTESELLDAISSIQDRDVLDVEGAMLLLEQLKRTHPLQELLSLIDEVVCKSLVDPPSSEVRAQLAWSVGDSIPSEQERREALNYLVGLSDMERINLLANWLISLAACDVSIMVSFSSIQNSKEQESLIVEQNETAGVIESGVGHPIAYCVGITDVGPKHSKKIISKAQKEHRFCQDAIEGLGLYNRASMHM